MVLLAILRLQDEGAYGVSIRAKIAAHTERDPTPGAIYTTLERIESKKFVKSSMGEATAERGGRAKRYYSRDGAGRCRSQTRPARFQSLASGLAASWGFECVGNLLLFALLSCVTSAEHAAAIEGDLIEEEGCPREGLVCNSRSPHGVRAVGLCSHASTVSHR